MPSRPCHKHAIGRMTSKSIRIVACLNLHCAACLVMPARIINEGAIRSIADATQHSCSACRVRKARIRIYAALSLTYGSLVFILLFLLFLLLPPLLRPLPFPPPRPRPLPPLLRARLARQSRSLRDRGLMGFATSPRPCCGPFELFSIGLEPRDIPLEIAEGH
eukprot:8467565-Pyramimonas_sp.AAC.1